MPARDTTLATIGEKRVRIDRLALFAADTADASLAPAAETLATGLAGAIGSDYRPAGHHLLFVEYGGKVSRLNLIPSYSIVSSGTATLPGTYLFDLDAGTVSATGAPITPADDLWWEQETDTVRRMRPMGSARIVRLGPVAYPALSAPELMALAYGTAPIDGSVGPGNQLTDGTVFAVRTTQGNFAKVQVLSYGYGLQIRWTTYQLAPAYQVLGTGWTEPEDIKASADGVHAYVTERGGSLLKVALASAHRSAAAVVSSGITAPHQIALDEAHDRAYVVEFAPSGRLLAIDLSTGAQTVVAAGLEGAVGLARTASGEYAYVSEQAASGGRVVRIRLADGQRDVVATGLVSPFFLTWADPGEAALLVAERDPANRVSRIELGTVPATVSVVTGTPFRPSSAAVSGPTELLACCDQTIARFALGAYAATGPMLLGVGHVPADRIVAGYADTSADAGYFFQVRDAPFGGTLSLMFNHEKAYADGARYYKVLVGGAEPLESFTDYRWSNPAGRFLAQSTNPTAGGYYRVRPPSELWYNPWLGYRLNTLPLSNGAHTVTIRLFGSTTAASQIGNEGLPGRSVTLRIDNSRPVVSIDEILHDGAAVGTCGIVSSGSDLFSFRITAHDPQQHLLSWNLVALWGNNQSKAVAADAYAAHASPTRLWGGPAGDVVPAAPWDARVPGDPTSTKCAHTFRLTTWARTIDGYSYLHHDGYHRSITLMLP